jgi:hypothetical protein
MGLGEVSHNLPTIPPPVVSAKVTEALCPYSRVHVFPF